MKVGIISMQRVPNYGSFLQAYGLRSTVESLGHDVVFIDYQERKPIVPYNPVSYAKYRVHSIPVIKFLNDWIKYTILGKKLFDYRYRLKYLKQLGIGYRKKYKTKVDVVIIGSDEVFNCLQSGFNVGFSPMLFGCGVNAKKIISYAASFGYTDIEGLEKYGAKDRVEELLESFSAISVRDDNSWQIVKTLTGKESELNLDPVLISDFDIPDIDIPYHDYVILYTYKSREYSEEDKNAILEFCRSHKKKLISLGNAQAWVDIHVQAAPLDLLAYIKKADFIITDTFHGSVFSIKYNIKFATLIRDNNKQKLTDLLERLEKSDRIIRSFQELPEIYVQPIDFSNTNSIIEQEKTHAVEYLRNQLS